MTQRGRVLLALTGVIVFLGIWEAVPRLSLVGPALLPPPSAIVPAFWREITSGEWFVAIYRSLIHYIVGLLIGSGLGICLGVLTGMSAHLEAALSWVVRLLRPIPGLAWVPFAILWFGISPAAATFIIAIGVFWINYFAALAAVQAVDRELIEVAEAFGYRSRLAKLVKVILPASLPGILSGLRTGIGQAWMAVVAAELFGVQGLGQRMMQASSLLATEIVVVYMITIAALYGAIDSIFVMLRDRLLAWKA
jgi:sulfonate transport system permease protein